MEEVTITDPKLMTGVVELGRTPHEELEMRARDEMQQTVDAIRQGAIADAREAVIAELRRANEPDRGKVPALQPKGDDPQPTTRTTGLRVTPAEDYYYRSLPADMQTYRKPESDYWIAEWLRGLANVDGRGAERMARAEDKLKPFNRAVLAEQTITAVSGLATGTGGALIPLPFSTAIVKARDRIAKIRALATRFVSEANSLRIPVSAVVTVAIANEGAVSAAGEGALTSKLLSKRKVQGNFSATVEMLADSALNIVSYFSERVGSAMGAFEDTEVCTTPGASAVRFTEGLGSATITAQTPAVANTVTYDEMVKMFFGIAQQYRSTCAWMVESSVLSLVSRIKTTTGFPLFAPATGVGLPVTDVNPGVVGSIFGRPVYDFPLAAGSIFFGDPGFIGLLDGGQIEARVSEHALWTTDSIAYRFSERADSVILLEAAFRKMVSITLVA